MEKTRTICGPHPPLNVYLFKFDSICRRRAREARASRKRAIAGMFSCGIARRQAAVTGAAGPFSSHG
jgi:hypothetical protein